MFSGYLWVTNPPKNPQDLVKYPSSDNYGSVFSGPTIEEPTVLFPGLILHFQDCGRKIYTVGGKKSPVGSRGAMTTPLIGGKEAILGVFTHHPKHLTASFPLKIGWLGDDPFLLGR